MFSYFLYLGCGRTFEKNGKERERKKKQELVKQDNHVTLLSLAHAGKEGGGYEEREGKE